MSVYPAASSKSSSPAMTPDSALNETASPSRALAGAVALMAIVATLGSMFGGPALGDHEALVALCARNMRLSGDWIVPDFLGTPFFRKPPLPYWLVAATSYLFPPDTNTGLPVTATSARFPSGLAALGTILLLWRLASAMFGRRAGLIAAVISSASLFFLLYSPNVTAEMLLTFCCSWAYFHFWFAVTERRTQKGFSSSLNVVSIEHPQAEPVVLAYAKRTRFGASLLPQTSTFWRLVWPRNVHIVLFYLAMGFGMLAKGPAPIVMTAMPLAVWWYTERPLRRMARTGLRGWREAVVSFLREFGPRTVQVFTRLWLLPGLVVFVLLFLPWMLAVAARYPHAWDLWDWQYWQRAQGNYEDTRARGPFYYLAVVAGLTLPWLFMLFETMAAPWMKRYARQRRGLLYAGLWALISVAVMSAMRFKKPYYIAPALPALLLMMAVVAERFYSAVIPVGPMALRIVPGRRSVTIRNPRRLLWTIWGVLGAGALIGTTVASLWLHKEMPEAASGLTVIVDIAVVLLILAGGIYIRGGGGLALGMTAVTTIAAFLVVWHGYGQVIDNVAKVRVLAEALDRAGVPAEANVLWADSRPDSRLGFYFNRRSTYMVKPEEIVTRMVDRMHSKEQLQEFTLDRANELMKSSVPVYLILDRRHYEGMKPYMSVSGHVVAEAADEDLRSRDWLVVTNASVPANPDNSPRRH